MKPLVIYHANCADGFGAAFAAWLEFGDRAEYIPMQYGKQIVPLTAADHNDINPVKFIGREIYILDFSLPKVEMDWLFANAGRVVWLDHHKTAFEMWDPTIGFVKGDRLEHRPQGVHHIILDDLKSGAMLAWEYFYPYTEAPMLIKHIDDYDRWQFKLDGTKEFNKALWSYAPWSFEQWSDWTSQLDHNLDGPYLSNHIATPFIKEGAAILRAHDQNVQSVMKGSARKCEINILIADEESGEMNEYKLGLAANCPPHLTSDVGHELANQSKSYGLCWTLKKEGMIASCSLRSNGDYDVSAIAKALGGGGHKNAAGFEVDIQTLLEWMK